MRMDGSRDRYLAGGFLGATYSPILVGKNQDNAAAPSFRVQDLDPAPDLSPGRLRDRHRSSPAWPCPTAWSPCPAPCSPSTRAPPT
jgi:hypothetical protein